MPNQYHNFNNQNLESHILFYGEQACQPDEYFEGNNLRKNDVLYYIMSGKGTFTSSGHHSVKLKEGDLFYIPRSQTCYFQADHDEPWRYFWIGLAGPGTNQMIKASNLPNKNFLRQIQNTKFFTTLHKIYGILNKKTSLLNNIQIASLTYQLFYHLVNEFPDHPPVRKTPKVDQYQIAIAYLNKNYTDPTCNIVELCNRLGVSRSFLYALFRKNTKISPQKYLMQLRIEAAKKELQNTTHNLKQIAHTVGYGDEFTFSKAFKRYSGVSPNVFRGN